MNEVLQQATYAGQTGRFHGSTVLVDGMRVRYERSGSGPALLLVHGLIGSSRNWEQNIAALAEVRTVYALDLPNMGESERVTNLDPGLEASADRIARFMDMLGIDAADVCGHSHGGAIAMMLAARHTERVNRLILFAPANPYCEQGRSLIAFYNSSLGTVFAHTIPYMPRLLHDLAHRRMYCDQSKVTRAALDGYTDGLNRESIRHVMGIVRVWWTDMARLRAGLDQVTQVKTLLVWGDRDGAVGLRSGRQLSERLGARLVVVDRAGHMPFQEKPDLCNAVVADWLQA